MHSELYGGYYEKQKIKKEILLITLSVLLIVGSAIYTFTPLNLDIINTIFKSYEKNNLFLSLFSVQATISVLSVSIIAIITGFQSDNVYGISIVRYITTLKPTIFKHKYLMITDLLITVYVIEKKIKDKSFDDKLRERQEQAKPFLDAGKITQEHCAEEQAR